MTAGAWDRGLSPVLAGVTRELTSLWCEHLCLPRDILTSIPPPGQSQQMRSRYLNGLAATYPIVRCNTDIRTTFEAS
jgi:hypothetical protein